MGAGRRVLFLLLIIIITVGSAISGSLNRSSNIAVTLETRDSAYPKREKMILTLLEEELRLRGFMGRIRILENGGLEETNGDTEVKIVITKNCWVTKKLLSLPYLINRYRREFLIESYVEIPEGKNGMSIKRITARSYTRTVTQYANNDKYDPGLFPNQSEEALMTKSAGKELAEKLSDHLLSQIR